MFYCYLLATRSGRVTYVGATTDPDRRLEQHNGKRTGGARATALQVARGEEWERICVISGIPEWRSALQIEWRWKQLSRRDPSRSALHRRLRALHVLLAMEKPTQTGIPYEAYPDGPPHIQWDSEDARDWYSRFCTSSNSTIHEHAPMVSDLLPSSPSNPSESVVTESIPPKQSFR